MLAMEVNDDAGCLAPRGALRFFVGTPPGASSLLQSPPPSAIHGRRRLTRHPCRVAHCAEPALGLTRGRTPQKQSEAAYRPACLRGSFVCDVPAPVRPPSRASSLPQGIGYTCERLDGEQAAFASRLAPTEEQKQSSPHRAASHHSSGRALARLQLLILIHPPPRQAEWRCSSGDGRAAPFDAVELIACRSKRSRPEGNAPG